LNSPLAKGYEKHNKKKKKAFLGLFSFLFFMDFAVYEFFWVNDAG
jgi:hypothetical protein